MDIEKENDLTTFSPSHFKRRVSFDNYQPETVILPSQQNDTPRSPTYYFPTAPSGSVNTNHANTHINNSEHPHAKKNSQPTSILKWGSQSQSRSTDKPAAPDAISTSAPSKINTLPIPLANGSKTASSWASAGDCRRDTDLNTLLNASPPNSHALSNHYSLQPANPINNIRKKSYSEMSDSELLALDTQFNVRSVDIQKSYGFNVADRLPSSSLFNSDKDPLTNHSPQKNINTNFKNLSPNAILKEYPTKPLITKNSICYNFKHADLKNSDLNGKFYLILLSNKSSCLSSLNYYLNRRLNKGDTLVICCSLSTSILGNDKSDQLDDFINSFTNLILNYLELHSSNFNKNPINITFEFFKSFSYFNEVLNLYQPALIIVGTNNSSTKSSSITTPEKKFISVVSAGKDEVINHIPTSDSDKNGNENKFDQAKENGDDREIRSKPQIVFNLPFKQDKKEEVKNSKSFDIPPIFVNSKSYSSDSIDSAKLSKTKTNDTTMSSLFDNLNDTPALELTNSNASSISNNSNKLAASTFEITVDNNRRRRSMLDVLTSETKSSLTRKSHSDSCNSNINANNNVNESDDDTDNDNDTAIDFFSSQALKSSSSPLQPVIRSRNSAGSADSVKPLTGHAKEKQDLFEKYQRRLSAVDVKPKDPSISSSPSRNSTTNPPNQTAGSKAETKSFFKRWFK